MKKGQTYLWIIWGAILVALIVFFHPHTFGKKGEATAVLHGREYRLEVADTDAKRSLGLGYRDSLCATCGMVFVFPQNTQAVFWMKGMRFNLDFLWLQNGRVVQKNEDVPFQSTELFRAGEPIDAVIELPSGAAHDVDVGEELDLQYQ